MGKSNRGFTLHGYVWCINYGVYYWKTTPHNLHICWNNSSPLSPLSCTGALILQVGPRSSPHSSVDDCIIHASLSNDLSSAIEERGLSIIPDSLEKNGHSRDQCLSMAEYIYKPNHEHLRVHNFFVKLRKQRRALLPHLMGLDRHVASAWGEWRIWVCD